MDSAQSIRVNLRSVAVRIACLLSPGNQSICCSPDAHLKQEKIAGSFKLVHVLSCGSLSQATTARRASTMRTIATSSSRPQIRIAHLVSDPFTSAPIEFMLRRGAQWPDTIIDCRPSEWRTLAPLASTSSHRLGERRQDGESGVSSILRWDDLCTVMLGFAMQLGKSPGSGAIRFGNHAPRKNHQQDML